ncbi:hypothetical protein BJX65DRAFT_275433 [Aspergillus insuetus]
MRGAPIRRRRWVRRKAQIYCTYQYACGGMCLPIIKSQPLFLVCHQSCMQPQEFGMLSPRRCHHGFPRGVE